MIFVSPHVIRSAKTSMAAVSPLVSASSLRAASVRLAELDAQAAWFASHGRPQDAADLQREAAQIKEGLR